jgi:hypothetical protein
MKKLYVVAFIFLLVLPFLAGACNSATNTTTSFKPGSGAVVNSDSLTTAEIQVIQKQSSGNSWQLDVLVQSSVDVSNLPNPTKASIGKTVTLVTDQDMSGFKVGDVIVGTVKYGGDVNIPGGIRLILTNVTKAGTY